MDQRLLSIYIGNEVIRIVDSTRKSATNIIINSVDEVSTPNGCVDDGYITDVVEVASAIRGKIIGKASKAKAVFTISSKKIASKEIVIPYVKGEKKVASILSANSGEYFPMSTTGDFLFAHNIMETFMDDEGKKYRINAVCAPRDLVECYYDVADELKLTIYDIDYVGNSVQQLLKLQMSNNEDETNLVLQIEKDATFVNVMAGKDIILQRSVPYGKNAVINSIMEIKKLTEKEAIELLKDKDRLDRNVTEEEYSEALRYLISSIGRIVEYHRSRNPERIIDGIKVFGEGASIAGIDEILKQELGADVTRFNSLVGIKVSQKSYLSSDQALRFLACFGAALNPIGLKMDQNKGKEATSANVDKILIALIVIAFLVMVTLSAVFEVKYIVKMKDVNDKKAQIETLQVAEDVANQYEAAIASYNAIKVFNDTTHSDNVMLLTFLEDMESILPTGTYINDVSATNGEIQFTITTTCKEAVADVILQMYELDYVESFSIPSLEQKPNDLVIISEGDHEVDILTYDASKIEDAALRKEVVRKQILAESFNSDPYIDTDTIVTYPFTCKIKDPNFVAGEVTAESAAPVESSEGGAE